MPVPSRYFYAAGASQALQDVAMKKLIKVISVIMAVFLLASLGLYRMQFQRRKLPPQGRAEPSTILATKLAEGQISEIDNDAKTLLLMSDRQLMQFSFDDKTAISVAGHFVQPMSIPSGTRVTVKYWSTGDKNWAREILLMSGDGNAESDRQ